MAQQAALEPGSTLYELAQYGHYLKYNGRMLISAGVSTLAKCQTNSSVRAARTFC